MGQHFWFGIFTGFNTLLVALLALNVSRIRIRERIANGDGGNAALRKAIRAHGNGVEHLVVVGLQVLALELLAADARLLATLVIAFTLIRVGHAISMLRSVFRLRQICAIGTYLCEVTGAIVLLALYLRS